MKRGVNHNIDCFGKTFHIQTEATDGPQCHLDTHVFLGGEILKSFREALPAEIALDQDATDAAIKRQHRDAVRALLGGFIWKPASAGATAPAPVRETPSRRANEPTPLTRLEPVGSPDLETLLAVRRAAMSLVRHLEGPEPASAERLHALAGLATPISLLISRWTEYFRLEEIAELHMLRDELWNHLAEGEQADPLRGRALWASLAEVSRWLARINDRREIRAHDLEVSGRLWNRFCGPEAQVDRLEDQDISRLHALQGRDLQLDEVVEGRRADGLRFLPAPERRPTPALREALDHLRLALAEAPSEP